MKFNWDQKGMPSSLVSCLGQRNEFAEFKTVLNDARDQVMRPVDVETMARALAESGGRDFVEMVRELSTELANARKELEDANRRCERLTAELERCGIRMDGRRSEESPAEKASGACPVSDESDSTADAAAEWEEWDRRFQSLLG